MQFGGIGISNLPNQHCSNSTRREHTYNLIVVGAKGLGKTTFVNNLVRKKIFKKSLYLDKKDGEEKTIQFIENNQISAPKSYKICDDYIKYNDKDEWDPTWFEECKATFELTEAQIIERGIKVHFTVLEVDNIGDCVDNTDVHLPIISYINKRYKEYFISEQNYRRNDILDVRVHACLYFFEPAGHWIREIDRKNIAEISQMCMVIPIVARSDMFTMEEREIIKRNFHGTLAEDNIRLSSIFDICPFFVVSNHIDEFGIVYERQYLWGSIPANNKYMCDTEELKNLIVRDKMLYIICECDKFYRLYRNSILKSELLKYISTELKPKTYEKDDFEKFIREWESNNEMILE